LASSLNSATARSRRGACRSSGLPRAWRRAHHMDVPHLRSDGVRAAAEHALHHPRRACGST
jgi:hypothetical protein